MQLRTYRNFPFSTLNSILLASFARQSTWKTVITDKAFKQQPTISVILTSTV